MFGRKKIARPKLCAPAMMRRLLQEFARNANGATAVEFALVSVPFVALLLAIFQTAVVLFASQALATSTERAARQIMTGQAQGANGGVPLNASQFRDLVCPPAGPNGVRPGLLPALVDCSKLIIDVRTAASFSSADTTNDVFTNPAQAQFNPGGASTINIVRVLYQLPPYLALYGVTGGPTTNVMMSTAVFQTEPF
jgi:Flp pilus assembly protein TadG